MAKAVSRKKQPEKMQKATEEEDLATTCERVAALATFSPFDKAADLITKAYRYSIQNPETGEVLSASKTELRNRIHENTKALSKEGSLWGLESILVSQVHSLDTLFYRLAEEGLIQSVQSNCESLMVLAFRAQAASRVTIETLVSLKTPKGLSVRGQANIAQVQQVNNAPQCAACQHDPENQQNKVLEVIEHGPERMDGGTAKKNAKADPQMAALGELNRSEDTGGKETGKSKRLQGRGKSPSAKSRKGAI